ncbi:MAG TPA: endonuclease [Burkholderiaceae bacterium]|jgi:endonuclease-8|nr:endonuclease [Burkholderiaceae bacterium]
MPEGPSIAILREEAAMFARRKVLRATGNSKLDLQRMHGRRVTFRTWGKHFLICFPKFTARVHLLMFGSYCINQRKDRPPRLSLKFDNGELNFYSCALRYVEGDLDEVYDWQADVMSDVWNPRAARRKLQAQPDTLVCDALLDQTIFSGVGNIIKNEVLFRIRVHPESTIGALPPRKLGELIKQAREYSFDFYHWKKAFVLRKHWLAHAKKICSRCGIALQFRQQLGRSQRRSFFCSRCQLRYS